jgi:transcriptional regulator with XRE-family HTH domain
MRPAVSQVTLVFITNSGSQAHLNLEKLARRSGLSKQTLSKIEQGAGNPTVETLSLLGAALGVPARRLLTDVARTIGLVEESLRPCCITFT